MIVKVAIVVHDIKDVSTIDILGAYLHTDTDWHVIMILRGRLADLMATVDPKLYRKYIIMKKKGKEILYVKFQRDLYRLMRSALLFY